MKGTAPTIIADKNDPNVFWIHFVKVWAIVYRIELEELLAGKRKGIGSRRRGF